ncbi:MAG: stage III sporulation protein AB [Clostridiales bacterium]|nr:MAG: stage III sporulation protein AB [Clostridiales bacterium]
MLARSLGKSDTDGQSALILQAERALNIRLDEAVSEKTKKTRAFIKSMGFYFGILLVIMFF